MAFFFYSLGHQHFCLRVLASIPRCLVQAVISSSFESSLGLAQLAQLAAAVDAAAAPSPAAAGSPAPESHGLGTADWFSADVVPDGAALRGAPELALERAHLLVQGLAEGEGAAKVQGFAAGEGTERAQAALGPLCGPSAVVTRMRRHVSSPGTAAEVVWDFAITQLAGSPAPATGSGEAAPCRATSADLP